MRVKVSFTVDIDPELWSLNYGVEGAAVIREDVRDAIRYAALDHLEAVGVLNDKGGLT